MNSPSKKFFALAAACIYLVSSALAQSAKAEYAFQMLGELFPANGGPANIKGSLVEADDGSFYGTTFAGGPDNRGTIIKATKSGVLTVHYSFRAVLDTNGVLPFGGLVRGSDGQIYGAAAGGVLSNEVYGSGTVFKISTNGVTRFAIFMNRTNGAFPMGPLAQSETGDLYGVTSQGGTNDTGVVFKVSTNGDLTRLASFGGFNGPTPRGGLLRGSNGAFYGTTSSTIFKVTTNGEITTLVYFNGTNGSSPQGLTRGTDGNFYGVTLSGGASNSGTLFRFAEDGTLTTMISFSGPDGRLPTGVIQDRNGNFYGTLVPNLITNNYFGTLFKLTPSGELSTIFYFNGTNAMSPYSYFTRGSDGNIYGALTDIGGQSSFDGNKGAVFRLVEPPNLIATRLVDGVKLTWNSFTNGVYRLDQKSSLSVTNWTTLSSNIIATGNSTSFTNSVIIPAQGFYRAALLP